MLRRRVNEKEKIREHMKRNFFLEKQLYGPKLRARHTNLDQEKPERRKENPACNGRRRHGQTRGERKERDSFFFLKCKQGCLFIPNFLHAQTFSFPFAQHGARDGWGRVCVCELHARKREGRKETAVMASWGSFVYDFVRCSF